MLLDQPAPMTSLEKWTQKQKKSDERRTVMMQLQENMRKRPQNTNVTPSSKVFLCRLGEERNPVS
jgi:hypothetical protein